MICLSAFEYKPLDGNPTYSNPRSVDRKSDITPSVTPPSYTHVCSLLFAA